MRRSLAAALLGISLWIGALAWSGFVMTRTVLDPGRSEDVAEALLEDDAVRAQLVDNIAAGIQAGLPDGARVEEGTLEAGAERALESPEVEVLVLAAMVRSHRAFLGEDDAAPDAIDGGEFGSAARRSVVDARPELDGLLPPSPSLEVELPTERIPDVGPVRRGLLTAVPVLALVAAVGALLALLVTTDRPGVIRRAGFWAVSLSAFVLLFAYGVPALAREVAPAQAQVVAALVGALAAATRWPALVLAGAGIAGILGSLLWRPGARLIATPAGGPAPGPRRRGREPRRDLPAPARRPASAPSPSRGPRQPPRASPGTAPGPAPGPTSQDRTRVSPGPDVTRVEPAVPADAGEPR
ncbi:MAG: hypothetical protein ACSLFO_09150, partial [Acidimicrobiales bacterium]